MGIIDGVDVGILVGIGVDFICSYGLYRLYKRALRNAVNIENVEQYQISQDLHKKLEYMPFRTIPYGCVEGVVSPVGTTLKSHFKENTEGVMQHHSLIEHKSRRVQGIWSDVKNAIRDTLEVIPFYLIPHGNSWYPTKVMVTEPNSAHHIDKELTITHENFTQSQSSVFKKGMELVSGEVTKGYQESEKMLIVGTHLLAIGKLVKEGSEIKMKPPSDEYKYIISRKTKDELARLLRNKATLLKVFLGIFGAVGVALICYFVRRFYRKLRNQEEEERFRRDLRKKRELEEQRRARAAHRSNPGSLSSSELSDSNKCVICLNNEREVVLLDCGHVCLCGDCAYVLPEPRLCPICRSKVVRFVTTYTP
ncbi:mitochondrial ubiquitin ligase activator of NFKB 1-like [Saccostrea cucullata]|uniref:mitochondrial ubiquitin ligase activator of NFKB 1-like n=1 Tax=Saccostrea cuccullata TaxID=36930 RepID=UPI002ED5AF48